MSDTNFSYYQTSAGYKVVGKTDNDILLAGGGSIGTSYFATSTSLSNYLPLTGGIISGLVNLVTTGQPLTLRGTTQGANYITYLMHDGTKSIGFIGANGGAVIGDGGLGDKFVIRGTTELVLFSDSGEIKSYQPVNVPNGTASNHTVNKRQLENFVSSFSFATEYWTNSNFIPKSHPVYDVTLAEINSWKNTVPKEFYVDATSLIVNIDSGAYHITVIGKNNSAQVVVFDALYDKQKITIMNLSDDYSMTVKFPSQADYDIDPKSKVTFYHSETGDLMLMDKSAAEIWT